MNLLHAKELLLEHLATEDTLDHIGAVEAIHAVGPHDALLQRVDLKSILGQWSLIKTLLELTDKVAVSSELFTAGRNELTQVFPFHFLALAVEIKPRVLHRIRLHTFYDFTHFVANPQLAALLIYQVDKVLFFVLVIGLCEMLGAGLIALLEVRVDDDGR